MQDVLDYDAIDISKLSSVDLENEYNKLVEIEYNVNSVLVSVEKEIELRGSFDG